MMVWKVIFLFQGARILRFHVNLAGCIFQGTFGGTVYRTHAPRYRVAAVRDMAGGKKARPMFTVGVFFEPQAPTGSMGLDYLPSHFSLNVAIFHLM